MSSVSGAQFGEAGYPAHAGAERSSAAPDPLELELLKKAKDGDRGAYGKLVAIYQDRLYNAILRIVGDHDDARELAQETFTRGLDKLDGFRGEASPYTWLFRIATNLAISRLRKVQRHRTFSLDRPGGDSGHGHSGNGGNNDDQASSLMNRMASTESTPADEMLRRERNQQVLAALGRLDAEYRAVLVMRDIEGFDYQQMADVLGLPLGTLKSRLFRARLALRDELKAYMKL